MTVRGTQSAQMGIIVSHIGSQDDALVQLVDVIMHDVQASGQFYSKKHYFSVTPNKTQDIKQFFAQGYHFVLVVNRSKKKDDLEYRLFDTITGSMVAKASGLYHKRGKSIQGWAHHIAAAVWPVLTGQASMFSSQIAYCKEAVRSNGMLAKYICVADHDGSHEQIVVEVPTVNMAPRWNNDLSNPIILYSEHTNTNVRLVSIDTHKKRRIVSDFEGINMQPEFSYDGTMVVYCASRGDGCCHIYVYKDGSLAPLIVNEGNNVSPTLADDGHTLYFCSDFQTGSPQIYAFHMDTGKLRRITNGGYCASPSYCQKRKQLVYGKMMGGEMQLFLYDEKTKEHRQLTTSPGNKEECCWSPCGNYIAYAYTKGLQSRIAVFNLITRKERFITAASARCSYPAWSPCYETFPVFA